MLFRSPECSASITCHLVTCENEWCYCDDEVYAFSVYVNNLPTCPRKAGASNLGTTCALSLQNMARIPEEPLVLKDLDESELVLFTQAKFEG